MFSISTNQPVEAVITLLMLAVGLLYACQHNLVAHYDDIRLENFKDNNPDKPDLTLWIKPEEGSAAPEAVGRRSGEPGSGLLAVCD